jgi:hypothetical protein
MSQPLWLWLSPWDTYKTIQSAVDAAKLVRMPGFETGVLVPTLYDDWTQAQLSNNLGLELKVSGYDGALVIRSAFEAAGVACGGWSVPRGTGDVEAEGYVHGFCAAAFDYFVINFEDGWAGFWTLEGRAGVDAWLGAFWNGVKDAGGTERLNGNVGVTMVTNSSMMNSVSDDEAAAWVGGTSFDCLEAYVPGDRGLDPGNAIRIWNERLDRIGVAERPVVPILEQGDLPALIAQYAHPTLGAQIWTLSIAAARDWPDAPEPESKPACDYGWQAKKDLVVATAGELQAVADQITAEANRKGGPRVVATRGLAKAVRDRAQAILA